VRVIQPVCVAAVSREKESGVCQVGTYTFSGLHRSKRPNVVSQVHPTHVEELLFILGQILGQKPGGPVGRVVDVGIAQFQDNTLRVGDDEKRLGLVYSLSLDKVGQEALLCCPPNIRHC
jgi:hypothetical protein